eukprot:TRINITY_DN70083_c0_g1_i1.p1 TRINITY_DN70083_c0_g1~~TRINITY_DN70083_c0_g1_i1.p1  ORF type:complete len:370 (-),score=42.39 TRINITY_DN70083_c0_g1_i1:249-1358(-)
MASRVTLLESSIRMEHRNVGSPARPTGKAASPVPRPALQPSATQSTAKPGSSPPGSDDSVRFIGRCDAGSILVGAEASATASNTTCPRISKPPSPSASVATTRGIVEKNMEPTQLLVIDNGKNEFDFELSQRTVQIPDSDCCWLLSFVETLRRSGHLSSLLDRALHVTAQVDGEVQWVTASGQKGQLRLCDKDRRPVWQQILEAIFMRRHPSAKRKGDHFQQSVRPAQGMGLKGRAEELNAYLALLECQASVRVIRLLTPRVGLVPRDLDAFFRPEVASDAVQLFSAQVVFQTPPCTGICHCIAVDTTSKSDAHSWALGTFDQLYLGEGKYRICGGKKSGQLPRCVIDGCECVCDGILRITVAGLQVAS